MTRSVRKAVVLAALTALAFLAAGTARAQVMQQGKDVGATNQMPGQPRGGYNYADTSYINMKFDENGNLSVLESSPARDANQAFTQIYNDTLSIVTRAQDSLDTPIDVHDCRTLRFVLLPAGIGGATAAATDYVRIGVQIRGHLTSSPDSTNTWPYQFGGKLAIAVNQGSSGGGEQDTLLGYPAVPAAGSPWETEKVVILRSAVAATLTAGGGGYPLAREIRIPEWFGPYVSVRFRVLSTTVGTQTNSALHKFTLRAFAVCSPL